ncbi:hypothetical protein ES332_D13G073000v1 [Gossypium tomentosum]|uniref:Response regulatory domain-containing protein n=1 Tax=Gossypium tomentosum TaxID=34277 RepID=A0A5D2HVR7_GOSTO|nr:hypothetical protein ES332_D13G073000v1 [Gossypium tomentosum]
MVYSKESFSFWVFFTIHICGWECLKLIPHEKFSFAKVIIDIECFSPISLGFGSLNPPIVSTSKNAASPSIFRYSFFVVVICFISPNHASFKLTMVIESKCTIGYVGFSLIFYFCTISARLTLKFVAAVLDGLTAWEMLKGRPHNVDLILIEVDLPSISGFALTLIMEHDICKSIPVISMI